MRRWVDYPLEVASLRFFDVETTGLRPDRGGRIREMAVVGPTGLQFDWSSAEVTPCDDAVARQLPCLVGHLEESVVVGHNLSFDFRFVTYEAERLGLEGLDLRFADTLDLARSLLPDRDDHQLGSLLTAFGATPDEELHTAVGDALATRTLFWHLVEHGGLRTLADIHVRRLQWGTP